MTTWPQLYDPFDNWIVSTAVSALPVLTLFFALVVLKQRVWVSALCGLLVAVGLASWAFQMPPMLVATAAGHGFIFGMMRIAWIVVASILPIWLVRSMVGWRETWQVLPALLVSGASFAAMQFYWSNYQDIGLVDIVSAIFSLLVTVVFLKFWKPAEVIPVSGELVRSTRGHAPVDVFKGSSPFIVASVLIFVTACPRSPAL